MLRDYRFIRVKDSYPVRYILDKDYEFNKAKIFKEIKAKDM